MSRTNLIETIVSIFTATVEKVGTRHQIPQAVGYYAFKDGYIF